LSENILVELLLAFPEETVVQKFFIAKETTVGELKKRKDILPALLKALKKSNSVAINGKKVLDDYKICQHDRLVILRKLIMDPKEMRRRRANKL
jgi:putative ubiquitin-RnfH superfamily antitoxin RatB of RatAB toxin-antitoxin module